jgi:hypothetical protein
VYAVEHIQKQVHAHPADHIPLCMVFYYVISFAVRALERLQRSGVCHVEAIFVCDCPQTGGLVLDTPIYQGASSCL